MRSSYGKLRHPACPSPLPSFLWRNVEEVLLRGYREKHADCTKGDSCPKRAEGNGQWHLALPKLIALGYEQRPQRYPELDLPAVTKHVSRFSRRSPKKKQKWVNKRSPRRWSRHRVRHSQPALLNDRGILSQRSGADYLQQSMWSFANTENGSGILPFLLLSNQPKE